ncbi:MAG: DegV family protein [Anaerolineales bacterium]|nr:DegV family protein [Anaerolineales bacterium]MCX7754006.1 DegV family protein [Anaerolineales bacterium]MDW8276788.1 DegV family protein [Anaerolineales bacterium]
MKRVAILTDSTAYLSAEVLARYEIATIPLQVIWGEETFLDGVTIQPSEFYQKLQSAKVMPSTSQPSAGAMKEAFSRLLEQAEFVLGIFISSKLSGTVQSAIQGRDMLGQDTRRVEIFDSQTTAMAMGFQVLAAAQTAVQGASVQECIQAAEQARQTSGVYFVLDTLEFLHRGGRIGGAQRFLGTALNLKPILTIANGKVEAVERVRAKSKALERLVAIVTEQINARPLKRLAVLHANSPAEAQAVLQKAAAQLRPAETFTSELSPVIGTHVGPGTIGLAYQTGA